jgi:hypothetical protein
VKLKHKNLLVFSVTVLLTVGIGTFVYIYCVAPLVYAAWERTIIQQGIGGGGLTSPHNKVLLTGRGNSTATAGISIGQIDVGMRI